MRRSSIFSRAYFDVIDLSARLWDQAAAIRRQLRSVEVRVDTAALTTRLKEPTVARSLARMLLGYGR